jgi:hypothetical protein
MKFLAMFAGLCGVIGLYLITSDDRRVVRLGLAMLGVFAGVVGVGVALIPAE